MVFAKNLYKGESTEHLLNIYLQINPSELQLLT